MILIRQARKQQMQVDWIRAKLDKSEISRFTNDSKGNVLNSDTYWYYLKMPEIPTEFKGFVYLKR